MPTISAHVTDDFAETVEAAAKASPEKKVAPWLKVAAEQRLRRDGVNNIDDAEFAAKVATAVKRKPEVKGQIETLLRRTVRAART
jgi:hypothetical protein